VSKVFKAVGAVAGVVATVAMFIPGGQGIAAIAGAVSAVSNTGAALTAKRPRAQGAITQRLIGANNPSPYVMGRCYAAGVQLWEVGWGATLDKVENPYKFIATGLSCCGPVDAIESLMVDREAVSFSGTAALGYYANFLWADTQLGARPEADALAPHWSGAPNWGSDYKCSSWAAIGWSLLFDKKGKVFAGGTPEFGGLIRGVKVYDPRLDSTFPGGSGSHRVTDEATWTYSTNPALHAGSYAYGRWVNGKLAFGADMGDEVDFGAVAAWANVCDANGWTIGGTIYEPGDGWDNLKRIAQAGGAEPVLTQGTVTFRWHAARVALDEIGLNDLAQGALESTLGRRGAERINTARPKYMSEAHRWSLVQGSAVKVAAFETADGREIAEELPFELVTDKDQGAELALYEIWERREKGPFTVTVGPRLSAYGPGSALTLKAECGLWPTDILCIVRSRTVEAATGFAVLELVSDTTSKHAAIIGTTGTAPAVPGFPALGAADGVLASNLNPYGHVQLLIATSSVSGAGGSPLTAADVGTDVTISIAAHNRDLSDGRSIAVNSGTITGRAFATVLHVYYDDPTLAGGAVTYAATTTAADALVSDDHPHRFYVGTITTPADGGAGTGGSGGIPIGWDPGNPLP
jgi:hypothetical protein